MNEAAFRPAPSLSRALAGEAVRVGTENPAKLDAVRDALGRFVEDETKLVLVSAGVASGVAEQPIGFDEIVRGARNRARAAFGLGDCVLAVGLEDGLVRLTDAPEAGSTPAGADTFYNVGCAWMTDGSREGHGFSSAFAYPPGCLEPAVRDRAPIGALFDEIWRSHRTGGHGPANDLASGRQGGNIGLLTQSGLDRSSYGAQAVVCAMIRFLHTDLYD